MAGGPVFYKDHRRVFPKIWQRHLFVGTVTMTIAYFGWQYHMLSLDRYDTFKGRTALYGPDSVRGGMQE